jgi:site-specific DNA-methyltransferase (adenine-specific)
VRIEIIGTARLYLGDCREILPTLSGVDAVVTDPPYPNNSGHFVDAVAVAAEVCRDWSALADEWIVFWSEIETPPSPLPRIATHVWYRTNVNGKVYEPAYHFSTDGTKRRSDVKLHAAVFDGVGPGCLEYDGHPNQKPIAVMEWLVAKANGTILDPFMGSGTTGVACARLRRRFIGCEIHEPYFDIACRRIEQAQRQGDLFRDEVAAAT